MWDLNKVGTFGVLEFCRARGVKLVYAGSSTKFADGGLGRDQSPYAWTKASNTELVRNYGDWFGLKYAITYFYNVYGPGERADAYGTLIEIFRQQRLAERPLTVVAPGTQRRIFTHVDDVVDGLQLIGEAGEGDEFGLGADEAYSVLEVAGMFGGVVEMLPERAGNRMDAWLNVARSQALGWKAERRLADYIAAIVDSGPPLPSACHGVAPVRRSASACSPSAAQPHRLSRRRSPRRAPGDRAGAGVRRSAGAGRAGRGGRGGVRRRAWTQPATRGMRLHIAMRSRFAEEGLAAAVARGVRQYVLLGAGLDTFAHRNPFAQQGLRVFEVDHPATQGWKRQRLAGAGLAPPASLTFAPVDFERETLAAGLAAAGFDAAAPAFFSWLGVVVYLTRAAVIETLRFIASLPAGTEVVFDYGEPVSAYPPAQRAYQRPPRRRGWRRWASPGSPASHRPRSPRS